MQNSTNKTQPKAKALAPPHFKREPKFSLEEAFTLEGVRSYAPMNASDIPAGRALLAHMAWGEVRLKMDLPDHLRWVDAFDEQLDKPRITLQEIVRMKQLTAALREHLMLPFEPVSVMKLASIMFIDEGEDPYLYDQAYNDKVKLPRWKRHPEMMDFFLCHPLIDLMPYLQPFEIDTVTYLQALNQIQEAHRKILYQKPSPRSQTASQESS